MHNKDLTHNRLSPITILSLELLILGIGCIVLAAINIWVQSGFSGKYTMSYQDYSQIFQIESDVYNRPLSELPIFLYRDGLLDESGYHGSTEKGFGPRVTVASASKASQPLYRRQPKTGEAIGSLTIPLLKLKLPIIEGTRDRDLERGVGHFTGSVLPGEANNCVLSGHRDTIFRNLGKLEKGDYLIVITVAGKFIYKIRSTRIVDKDDKTVIVPTKGAVLTLTTCYPFYFVGHAPDRYIISADLDN